jgi:predicted ATP-dependent endonuclease of OLD family
MFLKFESKKMKLVVKNFGPIKECVIDLSKRYYFFVGYNNTGKTYLSKLIYDIFNKETLNDFTKTTHAENTIDTSKQKGTILLTEDLIRSFLTNFAAFLKKSVIPKSLKTNGDSSFILKDLNIYFEFDFNTDVKIPPLKSVAALEMQTLDEKIESDVDIYALVKEAHSLEIKFKSYTNEAIFKQLPNDFFKEMPKKTFEKNINSIRKDIRKNFNLLLLNLLLQNKETPFFLPANRIFILENADELIEQNNKRNQELTKGLLELLESKEENKEKLMHLLTGKIEGKHTTHIHYLVNEIAQLRKSKEEDFIKNGTHFFDDIISSLSQLMGGEIILSKSNSISNWEEKFKITHPQKGEKQALNLYLASSSINQLGTLFLYLKYWAKSENNFLMIDEPEENLHPSSQMKLMDVLLAFGGKGNRVLITTHSPLVAEIINNYLILNQLDNKSELSKKLNLADTDLSLDKVGIYYFNGETVTEHKADKYGTIFTSFKEAQDKVYEIGEFLGEQMFKQINKS